MVRLIAGAVLAAGILLGVSGMATAKASPLPCEHRTAAHIAEHGGRHTDDAWHIARGELPSCDDTGSDHNDKDNSDDDGKSRYCRKHFFC